MKHYLFEEFNTGIQFIVGADYLGDALKIAETLDWDLDMFDFDADEKPTLLYLGQLTEEEAEASGLDEY